MNEVIERANWYVTFEEQSIDPERVPLPVRVSAGARIPLAQLPGVVTRDLLGRQFSVTAADRYGTLWLLTVLVWRAESHDNTDEMELQASNVGTPVRAPINKG